MNISMELFNQEFGALTETEKDKIAYLGRVLSNWRFTDTTAELAEELQSEGYDVTPESVEEHISKLRTVLDTGEISESVLDRIIQPTVDSQISFVRSVTGDKETGNKEAVKDVLKDILQGE